MLKKSYSQNEIIDYYDKCEIDYRLVWRLKNCMAMHMGYWDDSTRNLSQALLRENEVLAERTQLTHKSRVLDAGCGVGGTAIQLAKQFGCRVTGITLPSRQVITARKNAKKHGVADQVHFQRSDYHATPFTSGSFDIIVAVESFCYANELRFFKEAFRLLAPGGRLIIADAFATRTSYPHHENQLMRDWLDNWRVDSLAESQKLCGALSDLEFIDVEFSDITKNVLPSSRRLFRWSKQKIFLSRIGERLFIRDPLQTGNIISAQKQNVALEKGIWQYGLLFARKPGDPQDL